MKWVPNNSYSMSHKVLTDHSFGKHMVSKNINLSTIKALMGHENIQTTLIYARSDEESMIRAVV